MNKVFEIDWSSGDEFVKGEVTLKRLNFREKNMLEEEATDIKVMGGTPIVKVSTSKMKELLILKSVVSSKLVNHLNQEISLNIEGIQNLPADVGEKLFEYAQEVNTAPEVKKD